MRIATATLLVALPALACAVLLFGRLGAPLLWQDEAETVMFGRHVLEYGYPKVHGPRHVVYQFGFDAATGVKERWDAYIGTTWGQFYFATLGLALAGSTQDPTRLTAALRVPFAAAGALGLALTIGAFCSLLPDRRARARFAAAFLLLACASVALQLHLREARYPALVVLEASVLLGLHVLRCSTRRISEGAWIAGVAAALVALFHTFYPACLVFAAALALERGWAWLERPLPARRVAALARELVPLGIAALVLVPAVIFFETFSIARTFAERLGLGVSGYLANGLSILRHLARFDLLLPAVAGAAALGVVRERRQADAPAATRRFVWLVVGVAVLANAANPLLYGRYFVYLTPLLAGLALLETCRVRSAIRAPQASRWRRPAALVLLVAGWSGGLLPKGPELGGRLRELREPARGPLDFVVPFLRERYDAPEQLLIATNYESLPLMVYLDSRVIGDSGRVPAHARSARPDVVLPRKSWPRNLALLASYLRRDRFERQVFPVLDAPYNTIPELGRWPGVPVPHRFETVLAQEPGRRLEIFLRRPDAAQPGAGDDAR